ncbi:Clp protease ClpP [Aneurinibacillus migulanus]|uniref:head maturation protease, ClpP-related n=1 Tax=Aneurinibacillus migulanus TaxID=47500 RepID=UPI002E2315E5|nr:head maturation protease, ClpP-related [Aneurinibacillus migulanus]MED4726998.1 Clp protease ClpP [Aneurinibacillus migulanus]
MKNKQKAPDKYWKMQMSSDSSETGEASIYIYGDIVRWVWEDWFPEDVSSNSFKEDLDELGDVDIINLYINSPGGSVFEGIAIYNMLKRHKAKINVYVDALAASIASVIAMAGDTIFMPKNSMLMIHNPWTSAVGNAKEFRKVADDLDRIGHSSKQSYLQKAGEKITDEKLQELLDAETWLSADEAYEYGLCDVVEEANQMAASISDEFMNRYKNVPKQLTKQPKNTISAEEIVKRQRIADEAKANSAYINTILGGMFK